jgi:UDP-N-acetylglucosamine:LPS N-acetylglucosamine transferase
MKILAIASGGGHWVQLLRLRPALAGAELSYVTVSRRYRADVGHARFHVVNDATRWNPLGLLLLAARLTWIILRERPDVIVTTGAAPGYLGLRIGRRLGARTIWLDSIANTERLSLSGAKVRPWADLWLTQWPALASDHGPIHAGAVL